MTAVAATRPQRRPADKHRTGLMAFLHLAPGMAGFLIFIVIANGFAALACGSTLGQHLIATALVLLEYRAGPCAVAVALFRRFQHQAQYETGIGFQ